MKTHTLTQGSAEWLAHRHVEAADRIQFRHVATQSARRSPFAR